MVKALAKYQSVIATECMTKGTNFKLNNLKEVMNTIYRTASNSSGESGKNDSDDDEQGEVIGGAFSGECYLCGKHGHKAVDCPSKKNENSKFGKKKWQKGRNNKIKLKGTCNNCGKRGHMKRDCWELESNKDKRPKGWKSSKNGETGNSAMDEDELSLFLNEDQEIGREVGMLCTEDSNEDELFTSKKNENKSYEMKEVLGELAKIDGCNKMCDMKDAYWVVPVPRESNWYIDTNAEESEDDEPPRVIKRRKIMVKSESEEEVKLSENENNDDEMKNPWDVYDCIEEYEREQMK